MKKTSLNRLVALLYVKTRNSSFTGHAHVAFALRKLLRILVSQEFATAWEATRGFARVVSRQLRKFREIDYQQQKYLPQSTRIEEPANSYLARLTMLTASGTIFFFLIWSAFTNVSEVTQAPGQVIPEGNVKKIQHLNGGVIRKILVQEGQIVNAGEPLVEVDDGKAEHDLAESKIRLANLRMQRERIKAGLEGRSMEFSQVPEKTPEDLAEQLALYENGVANFKNERAVVAKQLDQKNSTVEELINLQKKLKERLSIASEALGVQEKLFKQGLASRLVYLDHRREVNSAQSELGRNAKEIEKAQSTKLEFEDRLNAMDAGFKQREYKELERVSGLLEQEEEQVDRLEKRTEGQFLRSPTYGVVKGVSLFTEGEVLAPGKTVMEVVPITTNLYVELNVSPKDIGHVKLNQKVHIKFSSFDFSRYGVMEAELIQISPTTFVDGEGNPYFKVRANLTANYLGKNPHGNMIIPGMTVQASIVTGRKTVLAYLLKPIHTSVSLALSER